MMVVRRAELQLEGGGEGRFVTTTQTLKG